LRQSLSVKEALMSFLNKKILFSLTLCFCFLTAIGSAAQTVKVGVYENKPLVFKSENGSYQGLCIDILKEIAQRKEILNKLGFRVILAEDGREALDLFQANKGEFVAVILDLTMPHMDGVEAYRKLREIDKEIKVIVASGYSENDISERFAGKGLAGVIQKPFQLSGLREKLKIVLS